MFMRRILTTLTVLLAFVVASYAQREISGKIADEKGNALIGASVTETGTNNGTITDENGMFSLQVSPGAKSLEVSYIGYSERTIQLGVSNTVEVVLSEGVALSETVVTALGIRRNRNDLPYSAQSVNSDDITRTRDNNVVNSLAGKVAGLNIKRNNSLGGSTNIILRGNRSLTGSSQALFVVDGVPYDNSTTNTANQQTGRAGYDYGNAAADLNPDDIESMTVLKGAAASALYGSRAANGVVMITTKKGRSKGIGVTINTGFTTGSIDKSTFAKYQKSYGGGYGAYYADYEDDPDLFFLNDDINNDGVLDKITPLTEDASYGPAFDPNVMVYQWDAFDPSSPNFRKARPWVAGANDPTTFFTKPSGTNNSIFFDGGNEKGTFKLGYTHTSDKGILPNSKLTKHLVNFGATYNLTEKLTAEGSINFSKINGLGRYGTGYDSKNLMTNFRQWWQTNVDIKEQEEAYFRQKKNVTWNWAGYDANFHGVGPIYWDNPYWTRHENYESDSRSRYFGYARLNYQFTPNFGLMGRVGLDSYTEIQEERINVGSIDPSEYSRWNRDYKEYNYDLMANYNKKFADFGMDLNVGTNVRNTLTESIFAVTNGGLSAPGLYSLTNSKDPINAPEEIYQPTKIVGVFGSAMFSYRNFLFLDLTARNDVSSTLPKGANSFFYPSVSFGFKFSEFLKQFDFLTFGKLRINYAEVGNTAPAFATNDYYDILPALNGVPIASTENTKANLNLKPERTQSSEIGLELAFWNNRITFDATYYNMNTIDQIIPLTISRATGYNSKYINAGKVNNKGVELSLFVTPVKSNDFSYTIGLNWARNRNKVLDLAGNDNLQLATLQGGVSINAALNEAYGTIKGQDYVYTNGQRTIGSNGLPIRTSTADNVIGNFQADWTGGITNSIRYKNFNLSFLIDMKQGGDIFSLDMFYGLATGIYPETAANNENGVPIRSSVGADGKGGYLYTGVLADGVTQNTRRISGVNFGVFGYRRLPASEFVYDASFVKLREVSLAYTIPSSLVQKTNIFKGATFSIIGRNLWIIHKNLPYADPEEGFSAGNIQGYSGGAYPTARTFGFNLKLNL
jgi:TonB-linked SusC/RagA family outer membrane protein